MLKLSSYQHTVRASSLGYIVQSMVNTFAPLLFVTFQTTYHISLSQVSLIIAVNFISQIILDFFASRFADRIGYRKCVVAAQILITIGTAGMAFFPEWFSNPLAGLLVAVIIYGSGGGLTEVLLTPIVQACPIERKDKTISMLHAFYCWGSVIIILGSTLFFKLAGIENWKLLACIWAILPLVNAIYFLMVPMYELVPEEDRMSMKELFSNRDFWILILLMFCAGSCEMAIAQWASSFAEEGLRVSKALGDLMGPCMFAALKGIERTWYGKRGKEEHLWSFMMFCAVLCGGCYIVLGFSHSAIISLISCAVAGFASGVIWPGTFTHAAKILPTGGTALFGMLALAGDVGCGAGPVIVGLISSSLNDNLQAGFLFGTSFSILLIVGLFLIRQRVSLSTF